MSTKEIDAILIAGPTASGKSAFALELAEKHNGIIVNTDSMQVYRDLQVLTSRPTQQDMEHIPHTLYGIIPGSQAYSAGQWITDVKEVLAKYRNTNQIPIFTGGTGLYFSALLKGLSPIPDIPQEIRDKWRQQALTQDSASLHQILAEQDPVMSHQLRPSDTQRIVRALEVFDATGQSLAKWQKKAGTPLLQEDKTMRYVIIPERDEIYHKCNIRFDLMIAEGALDEVAALHSMHLDAGLPIMRAVGVPPLIAYLEKKISLDEAVERAKRDTRRYAKRQITWLKSNMITWNWKKK
ncbi:MAG: tRNA (adenosine(37)-N6)-dimethylallyltransferase MiaA [Pseudomonadota bacterium]